MCLIFGFCVIVFFDMISLFVDIEIKRMMENIFVVMLVLYIECFYILLVFFGCIGKDLVFNWWNRLYILIIIIMFLLV